MRTRCGRYSRELTHGPREDPRDTNFRILLALVGTMKIVEACSGMPFEIYESSHVSVGGQLH